MVTPASSAPQSCTEGCAFAGMAAANEHAVAATAHGAFIAKPYI
jgi:hypothetical protein